MKIRKEKNRMFMALVWPGIMAIHFSHNKTLLMGSSINTANGHILKYQTVESRVILPH